jgi:uncharacterized membrane protein
MDTSLNILLWTVAASSLIPALFIFGVIVRGMGRAIGEPVFEGFWQAVYYGIAAIAFMFIWPLRWFRNRPRQRRHAAK